MNKVSLDAIARERLEEATASSSGRSSETVVGGLLVVPDQRHSLVAHEDSVILLTVAKL